MTVLVVSARRNGESNHQPSASWSPPQPALNKWSWEPVSSFYCSSVCFGIPAASCLSRRCPAVVSLLKTGWHDALLQEALGSFLSFESYRNAWYCVEGVIQVIHQQSWITYLCKACDYSLTLSRCCRIKVLEFPVVKSTLKSFVWHLLSKTHLCKNFLVQLQEILILSCLRIFLKH